VNEIVASSHLFGNIIKKVPILDRAISRDKDWLWSLSLGGREVSFILQPVDWVQGKEGKSGECK
jgi:hypothetical protein